MKLSVVIPTYNYKHFLEECLKSILLQEVKDIEVLVVNDGSTDGLLSMSLPGGVTLINHEKNLGLSSSLNTGMKAAKGEYVTWISADNYYAEGTLQKFVNFLDKNKDVGMVCSDYIHFGKDQKFFMCRSENVTTHALLHANRVGASFMYRREVHDIVGWYDVELPCVEDIDMWIRVSKNFKISHIKDSLVHFRVHDANLSRCWCRVNGIKYRTKMLEKHKQV